LGPCNHVHPRPGNLGPWSDSGLFRIPTLVDLTVVGFAFTLDGRDGRTWATDVARVSLPRLAVFRLRWLGMETARMPSPLQVRYACVYEWYKPFKVTQCLGCGRVGGCVRGREVRDAVCEHLPAAYAAAGRALWLDLMSGAGS
jgi:hypothetical protein